MPSYGVHRPVPKYQPWHLQHQDHPIHQSPRRHYQDGSQDGSTYSPAPKHTSLSYSTCLPDPAQTCSGEVTV